MFQKIKKLILPKFSSKKIVFILFFLIIAGVVLPKISEAGVGEIVTEALKFFILSIMLGIRKLGRGLETIIAAIISKVLGPNLTGETITDHPSVLLGWRVVRDFANMLIVLGFVIVGIATALRYKEYATKKTLLPLIIVALLVNFSLVLCGLVIDAANITVDYFLKAGGSGTIIKEGRISLIYTIRERVSEEINQSKAAHGHMSWDHVKDVVTLVLKEFIIVIILIFVFLVLALLFLGRHVALMILTILAPISFFCYVFKFTKPYFKFWLNQFIQWCLVGVIASFFLFIAGKMITNNPVPEGVGIEETVSSLSFLLPIIFLIIGVFVAFSTSAMGAGAIMSVGGAVGGAAAVGGARIIGKTAKTGAKGTAAGVKGIAKREPLTRGAKALWGGAKSIGKGGAFAAKHPVQAARKVWGGAKKTPGAIRKGIRAAPGVIKKGAKAVPGAGWKAAKAVPGAGWKAAKTTAGAARDVFWGEKILSAEDKRANKRDQDRAGELEDQLANTRDQGRIDQLNDMLDPATPTPLPSGLTSAQARNEISNRQTEMNNRGTSTPLPSGWTEARAESEISDRQGKIKARGKIRDGVGRAFVKEFKKQIKDIGGKFPSPGV